jgi:hypothetical protein
VKFLGIEVERKTDILAMAAFLISVGSIVGQIALLLRGAEVSVDGPRQVILLFESTLGSRKYLNAISTQIYVNNGSPGYDDILKSEALTIGRSGKQIQLESQELVDSTRDGDKLVYRMRKAWKPEKIKAGDFVGNETLFVPYPSERGKRRDINFIDETAFYKLISASELVIVELNAKTYGGQVMSSRCFLKKSDIALGLKEKGWTSLRCDPEESGLVTLALESLGSFLVKEK